MVQSHRYCPLTCTLPPAQHHSYIRPRASYRLYCGSREMGEQENSESEAIRVKRRATFRICNVSSFTTEILEIPADNPALHVLVIPGNPGVVSFYKDFVESLYELLGGTASVTAVGHISHTKKVLLFAYTRIGSMEGCSHCKNKLIIRWTSSNRSCKIMKFLYYWSRILSVVLSLIVALLGLFPIRLLRLIVTTFLGKLWSATAVEATCSHLVKVKYHTMRNVLFMAMTEFRKLSATPDWAFMRGNQHKIAFLFGIDDHWGPLQMFEEISKQVPDVALSIEREGHTHAFGCTEAGSLWVAEHVAGLIKNNQAS
ncbi:uncharacterized protein LOC103961701 isoform X4 [Pyrus x bretschneideri]|uniref:uncharacterized protein LOC103961701 isoform X4 n=1 Tax=Pyrus x bretschneideri TaxID=225117 RepID=UPI00202DE6EC|nr:uncharacterized protein LOC103961701 isoform X4 [Pyrus x bretschneideri]